MGKKIINKVFPNYKNQDKWFSWWALFFWTLFLNYFGAIGYLIYKGNRK